MDQVSRPLLIALGGMVVLFVLWTVALKPKPVGIDNTPLAPTQAISKAKQAAATSDVANAKVQAATGGAAPAASAAPTAGSPAANTPAAPAKSAAKEAPGRLDAGVVRDMRAGKIVVVLFWNAKGADDIATRGALRGLDRHHGKVAVHVVPIGKVGRYPSITQNVTIAQSPTTLVIGRKRQSRAIVGLSEPRELRQAVDDALAGR